MPSHNKHPILPLHIYKYVRAREGTKKSRLNTNTERNGD